MPEINLLSIQCVLPDEIDKDEMYLKYNGKKVWPKGSLYYRLDTADVVDIELSLVVDEGWIEIELWDFDYLSRNDLLGVFKFKVDQTKGLYTNTMKLLEKGSTASYTLNWEIV